MQALADEGMKIGRLNFSHAVKYEEMTEKLQTFRGIKASLYLNYFNVHLLIDCICLVDNLYSSVFSRCGLLGV